MITVVVANNADINIDNNKNSKTSGSIFVMTMAAAILTIGVIIGMD